MKKFELDLSLCCACGACAFKALKLVDVDVNPIAPENSLLGICSELVKNQK